MTPEEKHLWYDFLWRLPITVKRQQQIGDYHIDFFIDTYKLVIEVDGSQHGLPEAKVHDNIRTEYLNDLGLSVVRYKNEDVRHNFKAVCDDILARIGLSYESLKPVRKSSKPYKISE